MQRTYNLHYQRNILAATYFLCESKRIFLLVNFYRFLAVDSCSIEKLVVVGNFHITVLYAVDGLADTGNINLRKLNIFGLWLRSVVNLAQCITKHAFLREVDMSLCYEIVNIVLNIDN